MKREDLLAYIGIALAIPGVILLFSDKVAIGILVLLLVVVLLVIYALLNRPLFTYLEVHKVLTLQDPEGQLSTLASRIKARGNHKGISQLWFRNLNADGVQPIRNITIDGQPYPDAQIKRVAGSIEIYKQFDVPLNRGDVKEVELSYELHGSFTGKREGLTHIAATQTKKVYLRVNFHPKRPVLTARTYLGYGGERQKELEKPVIGDNRLFVEWKFENPKPGSYHTMEWDW